MSNTNIGLLSSVVTALVVVTAMHAKNEIEMHKQRIASAQYCVKVISSMQSNAR